MLEARVRLVDVISAGEDTETSDAEIDALERTVATWIKQIDQVRPMWISAALVTQWPLWIPSTLATQCLEWAGVGWFGMTLGAVLE